MNCKFLLISLILLFIISSLVIILFRKNLKDNFIVDSMNNIYNNFTPYFKKEFYNIYKSPNKNYVDINIPYDSTYQNKTVYRLWCNIDPLYYCGGRVGEKFPLEYTMNNLPGWKQVIFGNKEKEEFMYKYFGKNHIITKAYFMINPKFQVARSDLLRYLIIYVHGGLYLDFKSCIISKLPEIPFDKDLVVKTWHHKINLFNQGEIINWFVYGKRGSPIIKDIINQIVYNILHFKECLYFKSIINDNEPQSKKIILATTGPIAVTIAIIKSDNRFKIEYNNKKYSMIIYNCNKNKQIDSNHYSQIKEELII